MAEIVTIGSVPKPQPLGGSRRVRILRACRVSLTGHQEQKLVEGAELDLPQYIWPSLFATGAAAPIEPDGTGETNGSSAETNGASAETAGNEPEVAAGAEGEVQPLEPPEPTRLRRVVKRAG